jgi:deoxycytidine triphosphate deaminase
MSIQSDCWIREQALKHKMIEPSSEKRVREGVISYGLSSYGYDLRVSDEFKIFTNANEGFCQILFFHSNEPCETSYADRKGKYQKQQGIVLPKL